MSQLQQMTTYASLVANGVFSVTQRMVINFKLEFIREELESLCNRIRQRASPRTNYYLRSLIDPYHLGILHATVNGATVAESQSNAQQAVRALRRAAITLNACQ